MRRQDLVRPTHGDDGNWLNDSGSPLIRQPSTHQYMQREIQGGQHYHKEDPPMAFVTLSQHRFQILWSTLEPMRRAAVRPVSWDSSNMVMVPEKISKYSRLEDTRRTLQD